MTNENVSTSRTVAKQDMKCEICGSTIFRGDRMFWRTVKTKIEVKDIPICDYGYYCFDLAGDATTLEDLGYTLNL